MKLKIPTMEEMADAFNDMEDNPGDTPTDPTLMEDAEDEDSDWNDDPLPWDQYPDAPMRETVTSTLVQV